MFARISFCLCSSAAFPGIPEKVRMLYETPIQYWQKLKSSTLSNIMRSQGYKITKQKTTKDIWDKYVYYWQEYERT